jgi:coenzyme PQQ precursor peptide PqqA
MYQLVYKLNYRRDNMYWTTPAATDLRFGFEVTLYIAHR